MTTLHVLYSPSHTDFVRDASGAPVTTTKPSPTRNDAPPGSPPGTHWMAVYDTVDGSGPGGSHYDPRFNKLVGSEIVLHGPVAVRLLKLERKA